MVLAVLVTAILALQHSPSAAFEVDLWPGEGIPVFEAVAQRLPLHELPSMSSKVVETLIVRPKQRLAFDDTRYRTMKAGRFTVLASTIVAGWSLGDVTQLSRLDYYSGKFGAAREELMVGDTIEYLQYRAEGTCFVRIAGSVIDADPCPTQNEAQFRLDAKPATEWWIHIVVNGKPRGWVLVTDATARVVDREG